MKKLTLIFGLVFLFLSSNVFGSTFYCADALEWWLTKQGKFKGATVCTKQVGEDSQGNLLFEITEWKVEGIAKPTDEEVNKIITDYQSYLTASAKKKEQDKKSALNKLKALGLTDGEIEALRGN